MKIENMLHDGIGFLTYRGKKSIYYGVTTKPVSSSSTKEQFVVNLIDKTNATGQKNLYLAFDNVDTRIFTEAEAGHIASELRKFKEANGKYPSATFVEYQSPSYNGKKLRVNLLTHKISRHDSDHKGFIVVADITLTPMQKFELEMEEQATKILSTFETTNEKEEELIRTAVHSVSKAQISKPVAEAIKMLMGLVK